MSRFAKLSQGKKLLILSTASISLSLITFFGPPDFITGKKSKDVRAGHRLFDLEKPEAVQAGMDQRETARLERLQETRTEANSIIELDEKKLTKG